MTTLSSSRPAPNRVAVFGSIAAPLEPRRWPLDRPQKPSVGGGQERLAKPSPAATAVLERVRVLLADKAPAIARPILDRALAAGKITDAERSDLLEELSGASATHASERAAVAQLHEEIRGALRRAAPTLAQPLLKEALASERLTAAQERRIVERLRLSGG
jgi:hypothetical protein